MNKLPNENPDRIIQGTYLYMTCGACPEQYDVYLPDGTELGYLRLRHGNFTATYPNVSGETVYRDHPCGDGSFQDNERGFYLYRAVSALLEEHKKNQT